jgi:GST-like protein
VHEYVAGERLHHRRHGQSGPGTAQLAKGLLYEAGEFLQVQHLLERGALGRAACTSAPRCSRGRMVNRVQGDPASQLHERHDASDFELRTQDKLGR